jgi:hypothetical protein
MHRCSSDLCIFSLKNQFAYELKLSTRLLAFLFLLSMGGNLNALSISLKRIPYFDTLPSGKWHYVWDDETGGLLGNSPFWSPSSSNPIVVKRGIRLNFPIEFDVTPTNYVGDIEFIGYNSTSAFYNVYSKGASNTVIQFIAEDYNHLPDSAGADTTYSITWAYRPYGSTGAFTTIGQTAFPILRTLNDMVSGVDYYRSAVYNACEGFSATSPANIVSAIWAKFSNKGSSTKTVELSF